MDDIENLLSKLNEIEPLSIGFKQSAIGMSANQVVMDIITPGSIVTDMPSFYQKVPVKYKYIAVGKVEVLEYNQKHYEHFKQFPETTILIKRLAMTDISPIRCSWLMK